ncbi:mechanosensitive ion channel domain-containing protein [Mucilaginibacter sp. PAMB04168]|uniref:mechanosensitive ion channel family protein n=1 Tax=Mucilaginibacter sp. PAMB04168 TaxID=3138567 RepID=UPI0031F6A245
MRKILFFRLIACCLLLLVGMPYHAIAQSKKKRSKSVSDSLRAAMLRRDSMMRYYKTSDTSTNNLLQRIEYYTLSFNQISNRLSKGLDTADISAQLPKLEKLTTIVRNLIVRDRSGTLRYLYSIRDILTKQQDKLDVWQEDLKAINDKLADTDDQLTLINRDSIFRIFPADSTLRLTFLQQRASIEVKAHKLDSLNKKALLRIGLMQNKVTSIYITILEEKDLINTKIRNFSINSFNCEYGYIWNMQSAKGATFASSLERTISMNIKLFKLLNGESLMHLLGLMILAGFLSWVILNRRKIVKTKRNPSSILQQTQYVSGYPIAAALLVTSLLVPYFYDQPPMVFLEIIFLVTITCVLYLTYKTCPKPALSYLHKLFWLTLLFSISNLFVEVSTVDRLALLFLSAATAWISFRLIKQINITYEPYIPYSRFALWLLVILQAASVLLNIAGRFSLAKIIGVTAVYNFWLAISLYYFVQILMQSLFLQLEANKIDKDSISSYLDFKLLQAKFKNILNIAAVVMWVVTLLQNLSVEDNAFEIVESFLTQSRKLGGTLFTFGSILIFVGVIWLASVVARIISYFYDFVGQHKPTESTKRKTRTSLLLIRIAIFSVGFLLAVGASGFPLDKLTIIISALGVGVGFGLQNIVNNLVSGLILAFEKPVQVGDVIEVANRSGTIKDIGMRSSKIATGNGAEIIIPNGDLISQHVINWTLSDSNRQVELNISVAYGCDVDKVKNILRNLLANRDDIMIKPAPVVFLDKLGPNTVDFKVQFWAADISMWQQLKSRILSAIYKAFEAEGIEIPQQRQEVILHVPSGTSASAQGTLPSSNTNESPADPDQ